MASSRPRPPARANNPAWPGQAAGAPVRRWGLGLGALSLPLLVFLALPLGALLYRATLADLADSLSTAMVRQALQLSLTTTLVTTAVSILVGTPLGFWLARHDFPAKRLVDTLLDLPSVLPPSVAGLALLMTFGRRGVLGGMLEVLGVQVAFTTLAVVLAQTFIAVPYYTRAAAIGFAAIEPELEEAAALDGAGGWQTFRHVTVPLAGTALLSGAVMTWARALGEFGATILFAGNFPGRTQTMPLAIYLGFEMDLDLALTLAVILVLLSSLALLLVKGLLHRDWR